METNSELVHRSQMYGQSRWVPVLYFTIQRGVLQESVLSRILFLLVMDPLLRGLEINKKGPSLHNVYVGAFAHADDIRTTTSNLSTLKQQVEFVQKFCADNGPTLNLSKCEVLAVSPSKPTMTSPLCTLDSQFPLIPRSTQFALIYQCMCTCSKRLVCNKPTYIIIVS